ncbi:3-oxoadipate enol-lactonase [Rhodosalinus halophilus]|uniref:3-oxoadipate enol-lactonase n=1 Tax=Rhodosalinus halophilus TaxID=2259333 RepID=A0A365UDF0_9RHOB|nr:3-oxoadipate enol-lactonase [Rhodosalinus halophilus]RBI87568.1 3-oxoadipate enol-lactonase [Rhodosalinus halophilus]
MRVADLNGLRLHWREDGDPDGAPVVFANSLGTDLRLWDKVIPLMPSGLRLIRYDKRGHGLSDCPRGPYSMGQLVTDAERLLDHLGVRDCVFVGLSIGGMIAQGLAVKRMDQLRAVVLSNTAARIGTAEMWAERVETARGQGIEAMADGVMQRWFTAAFRETDEFAAWRNMLIRQPAEGYAGCCAAIAGTDFYTPTSGLRLPALGIAGSDDGSTPADLVRETVELIPGAEFRLIRRAGHLPCIEQPEAYAEALTEFLASIGHG